MVRGSANPSSPKRRGGVAPTGEKRKRRRPRKITSETTGLEEEEHAPLNAGEVASIGEKSKSGRPRKIASETTPSEEEERAPLKAGKVDPTGDKKKRGRPRKTTLETTALEEEEHAPLDAGEFSSNNDHEGIEVSLFDYSVENHFRAVHSISTLCGMDEEASSFDASSVDRFSTAATLLETWWDFYYKPQKVRFAYGSIGSEGRELLGEVELPQLSSARVPMSGSQGGDTNSLRPRKDFVLHAGGSIWALDWCPNVHQQSDQPIKCEYLAIAAHPPDSSYHKMGAPLSGRGLIQIWCILNVDMEESLLMLMPTKRKGRHETGDYSFGSAVANTNLKQLVSIAPKGLIECNNRADATVCNAVTEAEIHDRRGCKTRLKHKVKGKKDKSRPAQNISHNKGFIGYKMADCVLSKDVTLPRFVLGLAHNGKVAWDAKWKPYCVEDSQDRHRMGYLAVVLGNGSLEVWEVPFPNIVRTIYERRCKDGTDPRFIKLDPVFKCSQISRGDHQCIPLTLEWSTAIPHNIILVGFHDGTVALWKFSVTQSSQDTRPLLCFTADNVPIRALAWAPCERNAESSNVIVTGGHEGLRFWDIRDPFRPLRDLNRLRKVVLSMSWLHDPGCILLAFDDGNLRILSLIKAANDVPLTGKQCSGSHQQGLHDYCSTTFSIWDVHVSSLTGLVSHCVADGCTFCFQLSRKAVEKDTSRNRSPLFLCGSLTEEDSTLTITTPFPNMPLPMKTPLNEGKCTPRPIQSRRAYCNMSASDDGANKAMVLVSDNSSVGTKASSRKKNKASGNQDDVPDEGSTETPFREVNGASRLLREIDVLPPKLVAIQRVRWNMNEGSERWLSYGGAAGIVRCQEVNELESQQLKRRKDSN